MVGQTNMILWIAIGAFSAIGLFILCLLAWQVLHPAAPSDPVSEPTPPSEPADRIWVMARVAMAAIIAIPMIRLVVLQNTSPGADLTVTVTGKMWHWAYEYPDSGNFSFDAPMLETRTAKFSGPGSPGANNHIVVPVGSTVRLVAVGTNLIYGWSIPDIGASLTGLPGLSMESWFKADEEGTYYGEPSELCGTLHEFKPVEIEVVSQERFDRWAEEANGRFAADSALAAANIAAAAP